MILIVAGTRDMGDPGLVHLVLDVVKADFQISKLINGGAEGVDAFASEWADANGVPKEIYPAFWRKYGKKAGPVRNERMAEDGDVLVAVWDGKSPGTRDMIKRAHDHQCYVKVIRYKNLTDRAES